LGEGFEEGAPPSPEGLVAQGEASREGACPLPRIKILILIIITYYFYPLPDLSPCGYRTVYSISHLNALPQALGPTLKLLLKFTRF